MTDISEQRLLKNRCGSMSLDKQGGNVDKFGSQQDHMESCPVDHHLAYKMKKKEISIKHQVLKKLQPSPPSMIRKAPPHPLIHAPQASS
ncbi:hypothetical protein T10_6106 [Trichinella papuae]|uniref:Uncharacterized protein n=1 Tax=Trichinella papuae TaxID=268474 RepID=A0A0V1M745_9BILA|nr:hypothetical protein T10_6106 [Trichinella papuae]